MQRLSGLLIFAALACIFGAFSLIMPIYAQPTTTATPPTTYGASAQIAAPSNTGIAKPSFDLKPGKAIYKILLEVGGRKIEMTKTTEITDAGKNWKISETSQSPMGSVTDESEVVKGTLAPVKRRMKQGPMNIALDYNGSNVKGSVESPMGNTKIDKDVEGTLFADGTGTSTILATLPLAEGYKTTFQNFDMMAQTAKQLELAVVGTEEITVPAGKFMAYKVEVKPLGGDAGASTIWVAKEGGKLLKERQSIPQMNGAVVTSELQ